MKPSVSRKSSPDISAAAKHAAAFFLSEVKKERFQGVQERDHIKAEEKMKIDCVSDALSNNEKIPHHTRRFCEARLRRMKRLFEP